MRVIRRSEFTAAPWKNGGGITYEAIRVPASGDPFRWRLSVARIEKSGPFSDFAAYHRIMVLLEGSGVVLRFANGHEHSLGNVGDLAEFDGALATQCDLKNGPCMDLNLMVAKSLRGVKAGVQRLDAPRALSAVRGHSTLLFPIDASVVVQTGGDTAALEAWDVAVISPATGTAGSVRSREASAAAMVFLATLPDA